MHPKIDRVVRIRIRLGVRAAHIHAGWMPGKIMVILKFSLTIKNGRKNDPPKGVTIADIKDTIGF